MPNPDDTTRLTPKPTLELDDVPTPSPAAVSALSALQPAAKPAEASALSTAAKPGVKTSEFWLSTAATVLGVALASGLLPATGPIAAVVGGTLAVLSSLGYTASRTALKLG